MMKLFFLSLICLFVINANAQDFKIDKQYFWKTYVFEDRVNLRAYPSLDSTVVATVPIGTEVYKLSNLGPLILFGKRGYWAKVFYKNQVCFVWSRLLAKAIVLDHDQPEILILYGCGKDNGFGLIKALKSGKVISEIETKGDAREINGFNVSEDVRINGIVKMMNIRHSAGACGRVSTTVRIAWDGEKLHHFFTDWGIPDPPFINYVKLILPNDQNGEKGIVQCLEVKGEMKEILYNENNSEDPRNLPYVDYEKNIRKCLKWDGKELVELN